jgi:hypothetical protein
VITISVSSQYLTHLHPHQLRNLGLCDPEVKSIDALRDVLSLLFQGVIHNPLKFNGPVHVNVFEAVLSGETDKERSCGLLSITWKISKNQIFRVLIFKCIKISI